MLRSTACCLGIALAFGSLAWLAAAAAEEPDRLQQALNDEHAQGTDLWVYNNLRQAFDVARRENKPLFVTFRCVPCQNCKAFDAEVAKGNEVIARLAREEFVAVRQVEMKGVDLSLFQFDHDLNWAAMFVNADGTVYARYGTQSAAGPDAYNSIEGLQQTMLRVLELHRQYPANADQLRGKREPDKRYKTALEMPGLQNKATFEELTTRRNCIHCHMIHDAENRQAVEDGTFTQDLLWRYPLPDNVGLRIDPHSGMRIAALIDASPAARAGLQPGEDVTHMNGEAITSIADMQWVLHHLPNTDTMLTVTGSESGPRTLTLAAGWKESDFSWRGSMWSIPPRFPVWSPAVTAERRTELKLPPDQGAYEVRWINTGSPGGRAAHDAGLREGDVIVGLDGRPLPDRTTPQFNMDLKLRYKVGDTLPLTVRRGGADREITVRLVE